MAPATTIEQRLEALEAAVKELQDRLRAATLIPNWLDKVIGSVSDTETFRQALEHGRAYRHADRPAEQPGEPS